MTELRKRMIEDMQLAGLAQGTREAYVKVVRQLAGHFDRSPDRLTERQLRDYLMHLREVRNVAKGTFQYHFLGIKFFFVNTLGYDWPLLTIEQQLVSGEWALALFNGEVLRGHRPVGFPDENRAARVSSIHRIKQISDPRCPPYVSSLHLR